MFIQKSNQSAFENLFAHLAGILLEAAWLGNLIPSGVDVLSLFLPSHAASVLLLFSLRP
jgi:hypothetical protein